MWSLCDLFVVIYCWQKFGGFQTPFPGGMTPSGIATGFSTPSADLDLIKIGEARKSLVGVKLDQVMANSHCIATHFGETQMSEHGCVLKPLVIKNFH